MQSRTKAFLSYYRPYLGMLLKDMSCALLACGATLAIPYCVQYITKNLLDIQRPGALSELYWMGGLMGSLVILQTACNAWIDYKGHVMGALMERDVRRDLFDHGQKLSFKFYDEHRTGQLMSRITHDSFELSELYHHGPEDVVISLLSFAGAFVMMLLINVKLSFIALALLTVMAIYGGYFSRQMQRALRRSADRIGDVNAQAEDSLAGIRVVQSFTNESVEQEKFNQENCRFVASRTDGYRNEAWFYDGLIFFTQLLVIVVVIFGAVDILRGSLDLADLLAFLLYTSILTEPIKRLGNFVRLYQEGIAGFHRCMDLLEVPPDITDAPNARELPVVRGDIRLDQVSFHYREGYDRVLKNLSLSIPAGEFVAIVGPSGAGKTTLCSLIPRFYDVTEGAIYIDECNIREIMLNDLRQHVGVVQQDVYLFAGTVANNIRYGRLRASDAEVVEAAKQANAHDFIMRLPNGYQTDIGQRGVKLSGGQKQRLSIARAFLKNPSILILDEATSALDTESERAVQDSLYRLIQGRTTIVIAHRLTTIRRAHRILVLTEQGIAEQGTHEQLLASKGVYATMFNMQMRVEDSSS